MRIVVSGRSASVRLTCDHATCRGTAELTVRVPGGRRRGARAITRRAALVLAGTFSLTRGKAATVVLCLTRGDSATRPCQASPPQRESRPVRAGRKDHQQFGAGEVSARIARVLACSRWAVRRCRCSYGSHRSLRSRKAAKDSRSRHCPPPPTRCARLSGAHAGARQLLGARTGARDLGRARPYPSSGDDAQGAARAQEGGQGVGVCEQPTAAEGCYGLRPQDLHSAYDLPTTALSKQRSRSSMLTTIPLPKRISKSMTKSFIYPCVPPQTAASRRSTRKARTSPLPESEGGWSVEISLDIETAHAICQNCHILLVEASETTYLSLEAAEETAAKMGATEISNSWAGGSRQPQPRLRPSRCRDHRGLRATMAT